jgi:hypothetical protein
VSDAVLLLVIAVCTSGFAVGVIVWNKARTAAICKMLRERGFALHVDEQAQNIAEETKRRFVMLRDLRVGPKALHWCGTGDVDGYRCTVLEYVYSTGGGKRSKLVCHTIAAVDAPGHWPVLKLGGASFATKLAEAFGASDIQLEDQEFNRRYYVECDDSNFAELALTPEVQALMKGFPKNAEISIGDGTVCVFLTKLCKAEDVKALIGAVVALRSTLPTELDEYTARKIAA